MTIVGSRRGVLTVAVVVLLVVVVLVVVARAGGGSPLGAAIDALAPGDEFPRASDAGVAFTRVSERIEAAADDCGSDARCGDLFTAAAFARVGAVNVLRCGRPEIFAFREGLRGYLQSIDAGRAASPPPAPGC